MVMTASAAVASMTGPSLLPGVEAIVRDVHADASMGQELFRDQALRAHCAAKRQPRFEAAVICIAPN